jgi:hypothetical protein
MFTFACIANAEIKTVTERNPSESATVSFRFKNVPSPSKADAASKAVFTIVSGAADGNSGEIRKLHDGKLPTEQDEPGENFFFDAGTDGGRLLVDLGNAIEIKQVNTYSWHPTSRGPQVYKLYASDGSGDGFKAKPERGSDLTKAGWKLIATVDTRSTGDNGGQHGVSVSDSEGTVGKYRYLLFDIFRTETADPFGNTFFSEVDVLDKNATSLAENEPATAPFVVQSTDGYCEITIDTSGAPELKEWAETRLAPVLAEWYPKIVAMLPSDGYEAPKKFSVNIRPGNGVAATGGTRVTANSKWLKNSRGEMHPEAIGALLHEEVHVIQQYGWGRRNNPNATRAPGWLTEGIPDYIRWFLYEPESHGADLVWMKSRRNFTPRYDGSYRISANFLNWVTGKYDKDIVKKLNAAIRSGKYSEDIWKDNTGHTVQELGEEWKKELEPQLAAARETAGTGGGNGGAVEARVNALTEAEKKGGWKLLFNGQNLDGWHNFKTTTVRQGWQVKDGSLACVDPHDAKDLCTTEQFDWFELQLDYNISEGGNSGIIFHATDDGNAVWATGPEFQLEDNAKAADPQRCGWLYALYQPPNDPKTGKPLDATKPAGEWNHVRLLITPEKCEHEINGVKYFEYVLGSDDFKQRVAKSKFGRMPLFAKFDKGYIALQGDHGQVAFRNIKIRPIEAKK